MLFTAYKILLQSFSFTQIKVITKHSFLKTTKYIICLLFSSTSFFKYLSIYLRILILNNLILNDYAWLMSYN